MAASPRLNSCGNPALVDQHETYGLTRLDLQRTRGKVHVAKFHLDSTGCLVCGSGMTEGKGLRRRSKQRQAEQRQGAGKDKRDMVGLLRGCLDMTATLARCHWQPADEKITTLSALPFAIHTTV